MNGNSRLVTPYLDFLVATGQKLGFLLGLGELQIMRDLEKLLEELLLVSDIDSDRGAPD